MQEIEEIFNKMYSVVSFFSICFVCFFFRFGQWWSFEIVRTLILPFYGVAPNTIFAMEKDRFSLSKRNNKQASEVKYLNTLLFNKQKKKQKENAVIYVWPLISACNILVSTANLRNKYTIRYYIFHVFFSSFISKSISLTSK